jgi:hypothetical protein
MKNNFLLVALAGLGLGINPVSAQTPFLETTPIAVEWVFNTTLNTSGLSVNAEVDVPGVALQPNQLNPADTLKTDTAVIGLATDKPTTSRGLIDLLVGEKNKRINKTVREDEEPATLDASNTWELLLIRVPQRTVDELLNTPYQVFLSSINKLTGKAETRSLRGIMDIEVFNVGGSFSTQSTGANIVKLKGTARTNLRIIMTFRGDSGLIEDPETDLLPYTGKAINVVANGVLLQKLQRGIGPDPAVFASSGVFSGLAAWEEAIYDTDNLANTKFFNGHGPVNIKFGAAKFQRRELFPEFVDMN